MHLSTTLDELKKAKTLTGIQYTLALICLTSLIYLFLAQPSLLVVTALTFVASHLVLSAGEFLASQFLHKSIRFNRWRFFTIALTIALLFTILDTPSMAQVFDGAESELEAIFDGGDGVADFFTMLRIVLLIGLAAGVSYAGYQGWRNTDITPVAIGLGVGVLGVIIIEIFQNIILGTG